MKMIRDGDGDLWITIPGRAGQVAKAAEFERGVKYVERWSWREEELEPYGPLIVEWDDEKPAPVVITPESIEAFKRYGTDAYDQVVDYGAGLRAALTALGIPVSPA